MKYLYIPLEIVIRELDGKSLIAFEAAKKGWKVIICTKRQFFNNVNNLPAGNVLIKSAVPNELKQLKKIRQAGHKIFLLDEEGVVTYDIFLKGNYRYNNDTIKMIEAFFFWGDKQKNVFTESFPEHADIGFNLGSPRFQFWKYYATDYYYSEAEKLKQKYGNFILFNTSFGIANNYLSGEGLQSSYNDMGAAKDKKLKKFLEDQYDINYVVYKEYLEFIDQLATELQDVNIIIRPHPSESERTWREFSEKHKNIRIIYDGAATSWILASRIVVHFKSTTSIEANVMNKSVITYLPQLPEYLHKLHLEVPEKASVSFTTRSDAIIAAKHLIKSNAVANGDITGNEWITDNINSAKDIIGEVNNKAVVSMKNLDKEKLVNRDKLIIKLDRMIVKLNRVKALQRLIPGKFRRHRDKYIYGERKEKGFDSEKIKSLLDFYTSKSSTSTELEVIRITEGMLVIKSKGLDD